MQSALAECIAPNTPSALADQLAKYLQTTFSSNIAIEHSRTQQGTEAAIQLWKTEQPLELDDLILDEPIQSKPSIKAHWHRRSGGAWWRFDRTTAQHRCPRNHSR